MIVIITLYNCLVTNMEPPASTPYSPYSLFSLSNPRNTKSQIEILGSLQNLLFTIGQLCFPVRNELLSGLLTYWQFRLRPLMQGRTQGCPSLTYFLLGKVNHPCYTTIVHYIPSKQIRNFWVIQQTNIKVFFMSEYVLLELMLNCSCPVVAK